MISIETRRQLVHAGVVAFALPVPFVGADWAVALCGIAVVFNWIVLPLTGQDKALRREGERFLNGVRFYPVAVMLLIVFLPLTLAQGAWAILAVGDAFSNVFGRRFGRVKLPWNHQKSWAGTIGFVATALPAAALLMLFTEHFAGAQSVLGFWQDSRASELLGLGPILGLALLGALVGAILESLPIAIDDNLTVSLGSGTAMGLAIFLLG